MEEAVHRFEADAFLAGPAARSEAGPGHLRSRLRLLHVGQARDPDPSGPGPGPVGTALLAPPVPRRPAGAGRPTARPDGYDAGLIGRTMVEAVHRPELGWRLSWTARMLLRLRPDCSAIQARRRGPTAARGAFLCPTSSPHRHWSNWAGTTAGPRRWRSRPIHRSRPGRVSRIDRGAFTVFTADGSEAGRRRSGPGRRRRGLGDLGRGHGRHRPVPARPGSFPVAAPSGGPKRPPAWSRWWRPTSTPCC